MNDESEFLAFFSKLSGKKQKLLKKHLDESTRTSLFYDYLERKNYYGRPEGVLKALFETIDKNDKKEAKELTQFQKILSRNTVTEFVLVIKYHVFLELLVNRWLKKRIKNFKHVDHYSFSRKLELLRALDFFDTKLIHRIDLVNKIRNEYAHKLDYKISDDNLNEIFKDVKHPFILSEVKKAKNKKELKLLKIVYALQDVCGFMLTYNLWEE